MLPNAYAAIGSNSPSALQAALDLDGTLGKSSLSARQIEAVKLAVSAVAGCDYCLAAHTLMGKHTGLSRDAMIAIRTGNATGDAAIDALPGCWSGACSARPRTRPSSAPRSGSAMSSEGVEAPDQYDFLVEASCRVAQGYLVSPPLPMDEFEVFRHTISKCRGMPIGLVHMAIVDHVQWRRQMVSYAIQRAALPPDSPIRQLDGFPALCLTQCALGKWYVGEAHYFAGNPMYQAIDAPHRALHDAGAAIVDRVRAGAGFRDMVPLLYELKQVSATLLRLLEDLEDAGLEALYAVPAPECPNPVEQFHNVLNATDCGST